MDFHNYKLTPIIGKLVVPPEAQRRQSEAEAARKESRRDSGSTFALRVRNSAGGFRGRRNLEGRSVRVAPMAPASRFITV